MDAHSEITTVPTPGEPPVVMQSLLEAIDRSAEAERRDAVLAFAKAFLRRLSPDELAASGVDGLSGLVRSAFAFADSRGSHPSAVRVFDPDLASDAYDTAGSVVETNTDDSPFLVDSVQEELLARGLGVRRLLHPVIGTIRDQQGRIERVMSGRDASHRESVMHFELDRQLAPGEADDLERRVTAILHDVRLAVRDFEPMQERVRHMIELARTAAIRYPPHEVGEAIDFLEWLAQLNFVLLGYREYELVDIDGEERAAIRAVSGSGLGILSDVQRSAFADTTRLSDLDEVVRARIEGGDLLVFSKTNSYSSVHRRARMDYIGVRVVNPEGVITGEARLIGLFTSKAYMEPAAKTPLLHAKLEQILAAEDLIPGSHDYKESVELFESFPKDELFQASTDELRGLVVGLLQLEKHGGIRVLVRRDLYGRSVSVVVALPRDRFNAALRKRLQQYFLQQFNGTTVDYHLSLGETESARIFFTVHVLPGTHIPDVPYEQLEAEVERLARSWDDDLRDALTGRVGPERGPLLAEKYSPRFPSYYKASDEWGLIVDDVLALEALETNPDGYLVGIGNETKGERLTRVKLYKTGGKVDLSAFMPILEALGLRAVEEIPTQVLGEGKTYIHDFGVLDSRGAVLDLGKEAENVAATISAVWRGETESDSLNRLVTLSDLDWRHAQILRALRKYRMRVSARYTEEYRNDAMAEHAHISAALVRMFEAKFDPARGATEEEIDEIRQSIHADLREVSSLDQDNILRSLLGTIEAIVRTNAYVPDRSSLSFKLRSARVPEMPKPHPLFEIFVYSPHMEAIHLRGGMIARGGIRWSDRKEDYRTEVLGLMKAQKVKNAVIVPDGSKGGFILRRTPAAIDELKAEVSTQYVTFMRGMLDITDNLVDGTVVHPHHVRIHDADDPYLVVAADKGTATFSDTANDVSIDYGFWLGDAFASGGSQGYDHKVLGITARGTWESVKRHFREIGIDVMTEPFTVVGIGDMSGDVFGNGMLYTPQIKLVCAFDHRHVFVDPDPDPATSFAERRRLFTTPGSTWADYDRTSRVPASADPVDDADHRLQRPAARRPGPHGLAGVAEADAAQLDRAVHRCADPLRGVGAAETDRGVHHPTGHALRRHLHGAGARASAGRRRLTADAWPDGTDPRWTGGAATPQEAVAAYQRQARRRSELDRQTEGRDKTGVLLGVTAINPVNGERVPGVRRRLRADGLRHRRDHGRARPGPARLGVRRDVRAADRPHGAAAGGLRRRGVHRRGPGDQLGQRRDLAERPGQGRRRTRPSPRGWSSAAHGEATITYKLRDWLFSRQRYWGEPFPIVYDENDLPIAVPDVDAAGAAARARRLLAQDLRRRRRRLRAGAAAVARDRVGRGRARPGRRAEASTARETNTMPNWAGSCWYELRYLDPSDDERMVDPELERYWMGPQRSRRHGRRRPVRRRRRARRAAPALRPVLAQGAVRPGPRLQRRAVPPAGQPGLHPGVRLHRRARLLRRGRRGRRDGRRVLPRRQAGQPRVREDRQEPEEHGHAGRDDRRVRRRHAPALRDVHRAARPEPPVGDQGRRRRVPAAAAHLAHGRRRGDRRRPAARRRRRRGDAARAAPHHRRRARRA